MRRAAFYCAISLICIGYAQARSIPALEKLAVAGRSQPINLIVVIDELCVPLGPISMNVIDPPRIGAVSIERGKTRPNFPSFNPSTKCNTRQVESTQIVYSPPAGSSGEDSFTPEAVTEMGTLIRHEYHVAIG